MTSEPVAGEPRKEDAVEERTPSPLGNVITAQVELSLLRLKLATIRAVVVQTPVSDRSPAPSTDGGPRRRADVRHVRSPVSRRRNRRGRWRRAPGLRHVSSSSSVTRLLTAARQELDG